MLIPVIITSFKLYKSFEDIKLKKKLGLFFLGLYGILFTLYGLVYYNYSDDLLFRLIWNIATSIITLICAGLIYYAWVHRL